jgi:antitoxin ParD1/3/4
MPVDHFVSFIEAQIAQGRYDSPSDVVHANLRHLEEQETKLAALRAALIDGETSGTIDSVRFRGFRRTQARCRNPRAVTRFVVSPRAQADLDSICDYTVKYWGSNRQSSMSAN